MDSLTNQDRATRLALFLDQDQWVAPVPANDRTGQVTRDRYATTHHISLDRVAVLKSCLDHPRTAAVDCLDCVPLD